MDSTNAPPAPESTLKAPAVSPAHLRNLVIRSRDFEFDLKPPKGCNIPLVRKALEVLFQTVPTLTKEVKYAASLRFSYLTPSERRFVELEFEDYVDYRLGTYVKTQEAIKQVAEQAEKNRLAAQTNQLVDKLKQQVGG